MQRGQDIAVAFSGLYLVHHNLPGSAHAPHQHADHQLLLPLSGEIRVAVAGGSIGCGPGRMVYLPPDCQHAFTSSAREGERLVALLDPRIWRDATPPDLPPVVVPAHQLVKELLFYLLLNAATPHAAALIATLIDAVASTLTARAGAAAAATWTGKARDERVRKAVRLLQDNLEEPLPMDEVARRAGLGVRTLNRLFLAEIGLTPKQAQAHARIDKARAMLTGSNASVTEAAFAVGYRSLSQFITVFRQVTGQLPSEVRRDGQHPQTVGRKPKAGSRGIA